MKIELVSRKEGTEMKSELELSLGHNQDVLRSLFAAAALFRMNARSDLADEAPDVIAKRAWAQADELLEQWQRINAGAS